MRRPGVKAAVLAGALVAAACGRPATRWDPIDVKALDQQKAPAGERLVLLAEETVTFAVDPETQRAYAEVETHERIRALKAGALQRQISRGFDRTFHGRPVIDGRVIFPDGQQQPLELERAWDSPAWDSAILYADTRVLSVPVPILPKGSVLEYSVKSRVNDLKPFQFAYMLGGADPMRVDRFRVIAPKAWKLEWMVRQLGEPTTIEPTLEERATDRVWTWEVRDQRAHPREPYGVHLGLELPVVIVRLKEWQDQGKTETAFASPKELSAWVFGKVDALWAPDDAMRATVKQVLEGAPDDPREKARRLYEHACRKVQYCAIEVGYGGWFPHPATQVQQSGFGDCKDKANYLKGLLDVAGIKSRPTLIYAHDGYPLPFGLPSLAANFNHQILTIDLPDGPLLVDPTSRTVAFGDLPVSDREATVLPIEPGGAELSTAPAAVPQEHTETERFSLSVAEDGFGKGSFELETTGALAAALRQRLIGSVPSKRKEVLSSWLDLHAVNVTEVIETKGLELVPALSVTGRIEVPRLVLGDQKARLVRLSAFAPQWLPTLDEGPRRTPLVLWNRYQKTGQVKLELPAGLKVKRAPPPFARESKWLDYRLTYEAQGATLVARRELTLKERIIPTAELPAYREVLDSVHLAENAAVLLEGSK